LGKLKLARQEVNFRKKTMKKKINLTSREGWIQLRGLHDGGTDINLQNAGRRIVKMGGIATNRSQLEQEKKGGFVKELGGFR